MDRYAESKKKRKVLDLFDEHGNIVQGVSLRKRQKALIKDAISGFRKKLKHTMEDVKFDPDLLKNRIQLGKFAKLEKVKVEAFMELRMTFDQWVRLMSIYITQTYSET